MKGSYLEHKGYYGSVEFSEEDEVMHGQLLFIRDLITYESETAKNLKKEFICAVDDYLKFCEQEGKTPDKPFKGSFNVRVGRELHRRIILSLKDGESLNSFITEAVKEKLER